MGGQRFTGRATSIPGGLAIGAAVSMLVTVLVAAIGAHLVMSGIIPQEQIGYCSICALVSAGIVGALTASTKVKRKRLMICMLNGLIYYLILLSLTALFFGGQYDGMGVTFAVIALASLAAALIGSRQGGNNNRIIRKKTNSKLYKVHKQRTEPVLNIGFASFLAKPIFSGAFG